MDTRRLGVCEHEAGHALARWFFGFGTDRAVVMTPAEFLAGRRFRTGRGALVSCEGLVEGHDILPWPYGPREAIGGRAEQVREDRWRTCRRDVELIGCYAGFHAEAYGRGIHPMTAALAGGHQDLAQFTLVMAAWFPGVGPRDRHVGYEALEKDVSAWARALVRSATGWAAIQDMAAVLRRRGRLSGRQIATACRRAYGGRECPFDAWVPHWPPTTRQLRDGYVPERKVRETVAGRVDYGMVGTPAR